MKRALMRFSAVLSLSISCICACKAGTPAPAQPTPITRIDAPQGGKIVYGSVAGATTQPTLKPGTTIFEKEPSRMVCAGISAAKGVLGVPAKRNSP